MPLWKNSDWKRPQEVSSPTCCSKWDLHQGQTRTLFIQVLNPPKTKVCQSLCSCSGACLSSPGRTFSLGQVTPAPLRFVSDVLLCALCTDLCVGPGDLLSAPRSLFFSSLYLPISHSLSSHSSVPLSILVALHQTHSASSVPVMYWGCPKLPVVFPVALKSAKCQGAMVSVDQGGCAPAGTAQCCHRVLRFWVQGCICAHVLTTDVSHPPATQRCKEPHSCAHVGTHTCQITPPAAPDSSFSILFHIFQLSLVRLLAPWPFQALLLSHVPSLVVLPSRQV